MCVFSLTFQRYEQKRKGKTETWAKTLVDTSIQATCKLILVCRYWFMYVCRIVVLHIVHIVNGRI